MTEARDRVAPATTAEGILEATAELFAEKGYDGARVDELARAAGVNKATLYYQIGDKEALYHAVLERSFRRTADEVEAALAASDDCEEQVRRFITVFARTTGNIRYAAPILLREVASGGRNLPDAAVAQMGRILGALSGAIERGQEEGRFRPVNSFMVHMMIVGSLTLYAANEPIRRRNAERHPEIYQPEHFLSSAQAGDEIARLILTAIRTPSASIE
ncbi:MAG: TetR/AcrR family transcriptional regulator [Pseudomonadota bacterium]